MAMRLQQSLHQRLEQRLKLAPQVIQSIEILQLATADLASLIQEELLENPTLELVEGKEELEGETTAASSEAEAETGAADDDASPEAVSASEASERAEEQPPLAEELEPSELSEPSGESAEEQFEKQLEWFEEIDASHGDLRRSRGAGLTADGKDKKLEAMNNTAARSASLQDYLYQQLALRDVTERQREIGEHLIYNIDDDTGWLGYHDDKGVFHPYTLEELIESMDAPCTLEEAQEVLRIVQTLDPPGVGARGLRECLLLQIGDGPGLELPRRIIEEHLEDLKKNRLPKIARATGAKIEEVKEAIEVIATLNPYPGAPFSAREPRRIVPDLECELVDGRYEVRLLDENVPQVRISRYYKELSERDSRNPSVREYLKKKMDSARWLLDAIEQRKNTLLRVAREIITVQSDFLDRGIDALKPLKMQYVADRVGVHVSTVSRAINNKYIQTPRGVFPLRFFFTGGTTNADGEAESVLALKQKVKDVIDQEDKSRPLSDEEIARKLKAKGYDIARRTVTKYRKQLGIPSSRQRRVY